MTIIGSIIIVQTQSFLQTAERNDFVTELTTLEDKAKEYYMLTGKMPVKDGEEYTLEQIKSKLSNDDQKNALQNEVVQNKDAGKKFYVIDVNMLSIDTLNKGIGKEETDIYIIAQDTFNIYYLKGEIIENKLVFSTITLIEENKIDANVSVIGTGQTLKNDLVVTKNVNSWTNEVILTVQNSLKDGQSLQYSIAGSQAKDVIDNKITLNASTMTADEKTAFSTNKNITITLLESGKVVQSLQVSLTNLDIIPPVLGEIVYLDLTNSAYNKVQIKYSETGGSGIRALYYDFVTKLENDVNVQYYADRSNVQKEELIKLGKYSPDGIITLDKNISSIVVVAVDEAGNMSELGYYN